MRPSTPHIREPAIVAQRPLSAVFPGRDLLASVCGMRPPNKRVAATVAVHVAAAVAAELSPVPAPGQPGGRDPSQGGTVGQARPGSRRRVPGEWQG